MGLHQESSQTQYIKDCLGVVKNINRLSTGGMQEKLLNAVNLQLTAAGVPKVTKGTDASSQANGVFDFQDWRITFGAPLMTVASMTTLRLGVNTVYHEARHCEQWFRMIQGVAEGRLNKQIRERIDHQNPDEIAAKLWVPRRIVDRAMNNADYGGNAWLDVEAWWNSVYARRSAIRGIKLAHINNRYDDYRNLAEERDAWALGDRVEDAFANRCPRLGCPRYKYWKDVTSRFWYRRSRELSEVDKALAAYDKDQTPKNRANLKTAFDKWYDLKKAKGGTRRAQGKIDAVSQLKKYLDDFNASGMPSGAVKVW